MAKLAALKRRLRNTLTSSIGWVVFPSQSTNKAMIALPTANAPSTVESVQPRSEASMSPHTIAVRPAIESPAPGKSSAFGSGSRDSGIRIVPATRPAITIGMFTRNTLLQSRYSIRRPPEIGPMTMPIPATAAQIAIALGRSWSGKMFVRIESVVGMIAAAPTPIRARDAISSVEPFDSAAQTEPAPNTSRPKVSAFLRPKRSPRLPAMSSSTANTSR
jgi:hypothetical protein